MLNEKSIEIFQNNLNEYLQAYCKRLLYVEIEQLYHQDYHRTNLVTPLNCKEELGQNKTIDFMENKQALVLVFQHKLECSLILNYDSLQSVNTKISSFVDEYLRFANADNKSSPIHYPAVKLRLRACSCPQENAISAR